MRFKMENRIQILSTRPIQQSLIKDARDAGIDIDELTFIETNPIQSKLVDKEIENTLKERATVVFTSMNAVEVVGNQIKEHQPNWKIYCMGTTTQQLVVKFFGQNAIAGTANDAASLAKQIIKNQPKEKLIFFCGDQRRDELPELLKQHSIEAKETIVYETTAIHHLIQKQYDGILFFSPSAVESFFTNNKAVENTVLFAIGNTTAKELKKHSNNKIVISNEPGKENLAKTMINFFNA